MSRKLLLILVLVLLLSGCGQRRPPDVEHFQGDVVATLQKPISQGPPEFVDTDLPSSGDSEITPQASQPIPTDQPGSTPSPTASNPQTTGYPVTTETTPLTPAPYATANLTQTVTPTLGVPVWQGVWKIWYQTASGGYSPADLTVQVNGTRLTGAAKIDGIDFTFKGDISTDGTQVEGEWQTSTNDGIFWWRINSAETFAGSRENRFGFCGNRTAVQPNPCREVPQN
jgi:hypothetical protein